MSDRLPTYTRRLRRMREERQTLDVQAKEIISLLAKDEHTHHQLWRDYRAHSERLDAVLIALAVLSQRDLEHQRERRRELVVEGQRCLAHMARLVHDSGQGAQ